MTETQYSVQVGPLARTFIVVTPTAPTPPAGYPVLMLFHGAFGDASEFLVRTNMANEPGIEGVVLVSMQGYAATWNIGGGEFGLAGSQNVNDIGFVRATLSFLSTLYQINPKSVSLAGFSNGAFFCHVAGAALAGTVTGIAPVCGGMLAPPFPAIPAPGWRIAVFMLNGLADPEIPVGGGGAADSSIPPQLPAQSVIDYWVQANGLARRPARTRSSYGGIVSTATYGPINAFDAVSYAGIVNMGHFWPSGIALTDAQIANDAVVAADLGIGTFGPPPPLGVDLNGAILAALLPGRP